MRSEECSSCREGPIYDLRDTPLISNRIFHFSGVVQQPCFQMLMGSGNRPLFEPVELGNLPAFPDASVQWVEKIPEAPCTLTLHGDHPLAGAYQLHNESMSALPGRNLDVVAFVRHFFTLYSEC